MTLRHIIVSRTDSIGDVVLTLPLCGLLKETHPGLRITFIGQSYTAAIIACCKHVDAFVNWSDWQHKSTFEQAEMLKSLNADAIIHVFPNRQLAKAAAKAGIKLRTGTRGRWYHWFSCNHQVNISRKKSPLHEAQLNLLLASRYLSHTAISLAQIPALYGFASITPLPQAISQLIDPLKTNVILHPKSKGSAREWGTLNFASLAASLPGSEYNIFITGTKSEGDLLIQEGLFDRAGQVHNLTGMLNLSELISFIAQADALVAASTGPLHIAAALGKTAIGIYPPIKPMHPGRWAPLGYNASHLVAVKDCEACRKGGPCQCMLSITPVQVKEILDKIGTHKTT